MTAMQQRVINVISKNPAHRTNPEIDILLPWLRKKSQLLQSMEKHVIMDIIRNCLYQRNYRDDVIIKQGEIGDRFYIILSGTVAVYVDALKSGEEEVPAVTNGKDPPGKDVDLEETQDETEKKDEDSQDEDSQNQIQGNDVSNEVDETSSNTKEKKLDRSKFGKLVVKFDTGKSFGEIALISDDNIRNATIIADEDCHFLVIHRDLYNRSLKAFQEQEYADRKSFVDSHPLFSRWSSRFRRLLEMSITKEIFTFDSPIVRQGEHVNGLTFIRKGRAKVVVEPGRHAHQYPHMVPFPYTNDVYELEHLRPNKKAVGETQSNSRSNVNVKQERVAVRRREGYAAAEKKMFYKSIGLCSVGEGEVMGDVEMIMNLDTHLETVITTSYTEVYILNSKNFERLVSKKNPTTIDLLRMIVETKLTSRVNSLQGSQVPLLRHSLFKLVYEIHPPPKKPPPPLRGTKELPEKEILMQHLFDVFAHNRAALVDPFVPGAIYYREMMRDKARIRFNIRKRREALARKDRKKKHVAMVTKLPRSIAKLKAALKIDEREDEERLVAEIREEQERNQKDELQRALKKVNTNQLLLSQKLPLIKPVVKADSHSTEQMAEHSRNVPEGLESSTQTMVTTRTSSRDTKQVLQVNKPVLITETSSRHQTYDTSVNAEMVIVDSASSNLPKNADGKPDKGKPETKISAEGTVQPDSLSPASRRLAEDNYDIKHAGSDRHSSPTVNPSQNITGHDIDDNSVFPKVISQTSEGVDKKSKSPDQQNANITIHSRENSVLNKQSTSEDVMDKGETYSSESVTDKEITGMSTAVHNTDGSNQSNLQDDSHLIIEKSLEVKDGHSQVNNNKTNITAVQNEVDNKTPYTVLPPILNSESYIQSQDSVNSKPRMRFVNAYIQHRLRVIQENPVYRDWETSDKTLSYLEDKIKKFYDRTDASVKAAAVKLPKLKRYEIQEGHFKQPRPGGKVWIKPKTCRLQNARFQATNHQHVRYHMVTRIPEYEKLKRSRMLLHFFMDQTIENTMNTT